MAFDDIHDRALAAYKTKGFTARPRTFFLDETNKCGCALNVLHGRAEPRYGNWRGIVGFWADQEGVKDEEIWAFIHAFDRALDDQAAESTEEELNPAARDAGLRTALAVREANLLYPGAR
jgi:hypothetical protein